MESIASIPASVQPVLDRLGATPGVRRVILFGSRARGDADERSDVDLAIDAPDLAPEAWLRLWADLLDADTLYRIDLVRLGEVPERLRERIEAEGVDV